MKKRFQLVLLLVAGAFSVNAAESVLKIHYLNNTEKAEAMSVVGKITFSNETMYLYSNTNQLLAQSSVKDVRKITFAEGESTNAKEVAKGNVRIYPNPTQDVIIIDGLEKGEITRIFNMKGAMLKSVEASEQTQIDVTSLSKGSYLLQVGTQVLKFIKE